jgi:hypothetical protein
LVGFDDKAQRKGLPIFTAHLVVKTDTEDEVLIVVHNAVLNQVASTSLISEYQVRDFSLVWDPVSTLHDIRTDGNKGTCSFYLGDENQIRIPMEIRTALATFKSSIP